MRSEVPSRGIIALRIQCLTCMSIGEGMLMKAARRLYTEELDYSPRNLGRDRPAPEGPYSPR
jgi:hypothetical protein